MSTPKRLYDVQVTINMVVYCRGDEIYAVAAANAADEVYNAQIEHSEIETRADIPGGWADAYPYIRGKSRHAPVGDLLDRQIAERSEGES